MAAKKSLDNLTDKEWLNEYAKDMGYKFEVKTGTHPYVLTKGKEVIKFKLVREARNHVLRDLHRYIGDNTRIVDTDGNIIEDSPANIRKKAARRK